MKTIKGTIDCTQTKDIPVGSVVFIYVMRNDKVAGSQTLQSISHFPFSYTVDIDEHMFDEAGKCSIRISIENGENTLFINGNGMTTLHKNDDICSYI